MPDNDRVALAVERVNDHLRVIESTRVDVLAGQIGRYNPVTVQLELGSQFVPHPAAVPSTMYKREDQAV